MRRKQELCHSPQGKVLHGERVRNVGTLVGQIRSMGALLEESSMIKSQGELLALPHLPLGKAYCYPATEPAEAERT